MQKNPEILRTSSKYRPLGSGHSPGQGLAALCCLSRHHDSTPWSWPPDSGIWRKGMRRSKKVGIAKNLFNLLLTKLKKIRYRERFTKPWRRPSIAVMTAGVNWSTSSKIISNCWDTYLFRRKCRVQFGSFWFDVHQPKSLGHGKAQSRREQSRGKVRWNRMIHENT